MTVSNFTVADIVRSCDEIAQLLRQEKEAAAEEAKREAGPLFSEFFSVPDNLEQANAQTSVHFERNTNNLIDVHHAGLVFSIRV
ncbi:hypothetical protein [Aquabacterium sp.]|uniref:hypothetical protein n=1 Tax=Aquabacterium sp. TaxID=1872578 RepID=UPI0019C34DD8|nr:hypothetical protein [Aquabacterium sp.]MBC7699300.1 hypothetical protein [Aquabacterium sp.]